MGEPVAKSDQDGLRMRVLASEARSEIRNSIVGAIALMTTVLFLAFTFIGIAEPLALMLWVSFMALMLTIWTVSLLIVIRRKPDDAEMVRLWSPIGRTVMTACNLASMAGVWIFLPPAAAELRTLMIVLYMVFISTQLLASTEATQVATFAILGVLGSLIAFILAHPAPHHLALALFLAAFGASAMTLRGFVRRAVVQATEARALSERAALALEEALAVVAAERDAKTRFIRSASHDLQQPVQAAGLYLESILDTNDVAGRRRAADGARDALASTRDLLDQMLDHLRLEAGASPAKPEVLPVAALLDSVAGACRPSAEAAGMSLRIAPSSASIIADGPLLLRCLTNLTINAVRHAQGERILLGARRQGGMATLWVIDDGRGVAPADAERLFEDFAQGAGASGGFGLGLSSVRRAAILMGGTAGLDRRWTGGAAFYIRLPRASALAREAAA